MKRLLILISIFVFAQLAPARSASADTDICSHGNNCNTTNNYNTVEETTVEETNVTNVNENSDREAFDYGTKAEVVVYKNDNSKVVDENGNPGSRTVRRHRAGNSGAARQRHWRRPTGGGAGA